MKRRVHVFYSGRVHGVGFRMAAENPPRRFSVVGWVKNLRGGQVELVAEGEESVLEEFLQALQTGPMKKFISRAELTWGNASDAFTEFEIRYY